MVRIKLTQRRDIARDFRDMESRARDLSPASGAIADELVRQNERVNFNPDHPNSILEVEGDRFRIGARGNRGSYARLLRVDKPPIAAIQKRYILTGEA